MVWAKKVFISGIYFRGRTNLVPGHFAITSGIRQNMKAKHPGNEVGGRNCKTAKINCKFVDTGITTLFLPLGTCDTLDTNSIPGGYTIGLGREYGVAPSCVVWKIRNIFPKSSGIYIPFTESEL